MRETAFGRHYGSNPAESYERYFVPVIGLPVARELMERCPSHPGERVLDVACGTGVVTRLAAEHVGPDGAVVGLDPNPAMLAVARTAAPAGAGIEWRQAPAESMPLPDAGFDLVLCQMGLQFMEDGAAALKEMCRVLAPGGRLALNVPAPETPFFGALADALGRHLAPEAAGFVHAVFALDDPAAIARLLTDAGFERPEMEATTLTLQLPPAAEFLWQYARSTPLAAALADASDEVHAAIERDVVESWRPFESRSGMTVDQPLLTAVASR